MRAAHSSATNEPIEWPNNTSGRCGCAACSASDTARAVRLDLAAGLGAEQVLRRKSGVSLSEPVPSIYGRAVFNEVVTGRGMLELVQKLSR